MERTKSDYAERVEKAGFGIFQQQIPDHIDCSKRCIPERLGRCPECDGSGCGSGDNGVCDECHGTGRVRE